MIVSRYDEVPCTCGRRGARTPQAAALRRGMRWHPNERAIDCPNRLFQGLHPRTPLSPYPTASCGVCPPREWAPHPGVAPISRKYGGLITATHAHGCPLQPMTNSDKLSEGLYQYLRRLNGVDSMVNPPKFSHFGHHLINKNGI